MGTRTLAEFRAETRWLLKNRNDASLSDDRIDHYTNAAYRHMCMPRVHRFHEMQSVYDITLVNGTNAYSVSEATVGQKIVGISSVSNIITIPETPTSRKRRLTPRNIRWFDRRSLNTGTPSAFAVEQETLYIHAVPGSSEAGQIIRVRFWREPATLALDTATTVLPNYYDEVLQIGSQFLTERGLGYRDAAQLTKQDYVAMLNEGDESMELEAEDWDFQVDVNPNAQSGGMGIS